MVRAQWEWTLFHLDLQFLWCTNIWHAHNRFAPFIDFRKTKPKSFPVLDPGEMRWQVMPPSSRAGTIKFANLKLSSLQVNACNITLKHAFFFFFFCAFVVMTTEQHLGKAPSSGYLLCVPLPAVSPSMTLDQILPLCAFMSACLICILVRSTSLAC